MNPYKNLVCILIQCCESTYPNMGTLILPRNARDFRFSVYRFGFIQVLLHPYPQPPFISHGVIDRCIHSLFTSLPEHGFIFQITGTGISFCVLIILLLWYCNFEHYR